jgi:hypothetical protein
VSNARTGAQKGAGMATKLMPAGYVARKGENGNLLARHPDDVLPDVLGEP